MHLYFANVAPSLKQPTNFLGDGTRPLALHRGSHKVPCVVPLVIVVLLILGLLSSLLIWEIPLKNFLLDFNNLVFNPVVGGACAILTIFSATVFGLFLAEECAVYARD